MRRRKLRLALVAAPALFSGLALGACGSPASDSLGHQACVQVSRSLKTYARSQQTSGAERAKLVSQANVELREALPQAGLAASSDTDWQALAATLSESSRVAEGNLVTALTAQCAETLS